MLKENTPLIETNRLILRKFCEDDLEALYLILSDESVNNYLPWFCIKTKEEAKNFLHRILANYEKEVAYRYAITLKTDLKPIGFINVGGIGSSHDFGYALRKEYWHLGITTEAAQALINHLKSVGFPFITATHDVNNIHSGNVMKKIGMTYRYSYEELWQPKNFIVTFRMYQLNFDNTNWTYTEYQKEHPYFIEQI